MEQRDRPVFGTNPPHRIPKRIHISDAEVKAASNMMRWFMDQECWSDIRPNWVRDILAVAQAARQKSKRVSTRTSHRSQDRAEG